LGNRHGFTPGLNSFSIIFPTSVGFLQITQAQWPYCPLALPASTQRFAAFAFTSSSGSYPLVFENQMSSLYIFEPDDEVGTDS
jgi:hypothetical protein